MALRVTLVVFTCYKKYNNIIKKYYLHNKKYYLKIWFLLPATDIKYCLMLRQWLSLKATKLVEIKWSKWKLYVLILYFYYGECLCRSFLRCQVRWTLLNTINEYKVITTTRKKYLWIKIIIVLFGKSYNHLCF